MSKVKQICPKTTEPANAIETSNADFTMEELQQKLFEAQQKELEVVAQKVEAIEKESSVGIGLQLDVKKLTDIIAYMVSNNKQTISLKFEVWKT